jgi:hypothetical protein
MNGRENIEKLLEAALNGTSAPSRFGTPESMKKDAPAAFKRPAPPFQAGPTPQAPAAPFQSAPFAAPAPAPVPSGPEVALDNHGVKSLDSAVNAELAEIMDKKIAREKSRKRRGRLVLALAFLGATGGAAGWVAVNPERVEAMKKTVAEIKSAGDIKGMVAKYQAALDKVAVRGQQIDNATASIGVDPRSMDHHKDQGFDAEMRAMMGEDGGKTTADRSKILMDKFGDVQKTGSLIKKKEEVAENSGE